MATNFLNPSSFIPPNGWKPVGFLGGMRDYDRNQDYRKLMEQQTQLQNMGLESAGIDLSQQRKNVPLKDLQRQLEMSTAQAQLPLAGDLAREQALGKIAESQYKGVQFGKEGQEALRKGWENEIKKGTAEQTKREMAAADAILQTAMGIQDPSQKQAYLQQEYERHAKVGYNIPKGILDPNNHERMRRSLIQTSEFIREMEKQKEKAMLDELRAQGDRASREKVANIGAAATRYSADQRASARDANMTPSVAMAIISDPNADPRDPKFQHALNLLRNKAEEHLKMDNIPFALVRPYLAEASKAKTVEEAARIDAKWREIIKRTTNPQLYSDDPRRSQGPINQGGAADNSDPLGLFK